MKKLITTLIIICSLAATANAQAVEQRRHPAIDHRIREERRIHRMEMRRLHRRERRHRHHRLGFQVNPLITKETFAA